jgi:two-component system nitrate/nitrite sensor histidine kinase NarX
MRHAGAQHAAVSLRGGRDAVEVEVVDDGRGLGLREDRAAHYGMTIMRERAAGLGGTLSADSAPGGGTRVRLSFRPGGATPAVHEPTALRALP